MSWLQRIATNVCLDSLRTRRIRIGPVGYGPPAAPGAIIGPPDPELAWVEPVSDSDLRVSQDPQDEVVLQLGEVQGRLLITTLVSYRDPALAIRCGLPPSLP
jgi:DNA-directed RNA polymerase specialized sigma24 family protein